MPISLTPFTNALATLREVLALPETDIIRDSAIQRFEYSYELAVKSLQRVLAASVPNPAELDQVTFRDLFRIAAERGLLDDPQAWFRFREMRNITSHAYDGNKAQAIYRQLPDFLTAAEDLLRRLTETAARL